MARRLVPGSLRAQLALAIALITTLAVGLSFAAVYRGTGGRLRDAIDRDLRAQVDEWNRQATGADLSTPTAVERAARRFLAAQRYHPASRIFLVDVAGARPVTNQPRILEREERAPADRADAGLIGAPAGLATVDVEEAGSMRVVTAPLVGGGRRVGTLHVADPLTPVEDAEHSLLRTFAVVGVLAVLVAVAAGVWIAAVLAAPIRRMARVAAAVDAGDLSGRAGRVRARGEVGALAGAFDRMLDRLERAFSRQRDFVSDASHELRTPLAVLRAQVELLDRDDDPRERHEATRVLLRRLDEMDRLVADMLMLASAEAGRLVELEPVDLRGFFEDLRRDLPLFGEREFRVEPVDGVLDADPARLTQVLRNLVRNAVAHTRPEDIVAVRARAHDGHLVIRVSDTGPGIAPEHLERVFERFYRADEGRSRDAGGSGLGLAIARAIVEAHGGRIRAEAAPGAGTTIVVDLPRYQPPDDPLPSLSGPVRDL